MVKQISLSLVRRQTEENPHKHRVDELNRCAFNIGIRIAALLGSLKDIYGREKSVYFEGAG